MCSITGIILPKNMKEYYLQEVSSLLRKVVIEAESRGRDSFGISRIYKTSNIETIKRIGRPSQYKHEFPALTKEDSIVLNNNRAEPTTEYVENKQEKDIQPFIVDDWVVTHNGIIANDKELISQFNLTVPTSIDSAVLPALLKKVLGDSFDTITICKLLREYVVGSYALAIANAKYPNKLILAANYKPLYLAYHVDAGYYLFTSLEEYLAEKSLESKIHSPFKVVQVPPYSLIEICENEYGDLYLNEYSLREQFNNKALVVCSGGLDSTVAATLMKRYGYDITLLHFKYKCRAEKKEVEAVEQIAKKLNCDFLFVETDVFKNVIRGSRLTETKETIADTISGAEFAHEWVPARNLIMLSIATGIAESQGFDYIVLGNNLEESGAYPDNEMEFIQKLNQVLPYATAANKHVKVLMPVGNMMKHEIVKLGLEIGAPLNLTWSCYEGEDKHCGKCGPCFMRKTAFEINHAEEVIEYQE